MNCTTMRHYASRAAMLAAALSLCTVPSRAQPAAEKEAATVRASSCNSCHGESGNSPADKVPRLNGQSAAYLRDRLVSFRYPIREAPHAIHTMGVGGANLSDGVIVALARFYAAEAPPAPGAGTNTMGAVLYRQGAKDIPACQGCHGANGEGRGAVPRLAGQHKAYLLAQLQAFTIAARIADPMNHHVWVMTDQQAQAVAAYIGN